MTDSAPVRTRRVEMPCQMYDVLLPEPLPPDLNRSAMDANLAAAREALDALNGAKARVGIAGEEAATSCRLDGLDVTAEQLASFLETGDMPENVSADDLRETKGYLDTLSSIRERVGADGDPITLRLLREVHRQLLPSERGRGKQPGDFRRQQTWVGGSSPVDADFVPPRPDDIMDVMGPLERFVNGVPEELPSLLTAALAYAQLHMTQPFLTANGRLTRLLVQMILTARGVLDDSVLPLSIAVEVHQEAHDEALRRIRTQGDWDGWIRFFAGRVTDAVTRAGGF